jgi:ShK domain-like
LFGTVVVVPVFQPISIHFSFHQAPSCSSPMMSQLLLLRSHLFLLLFAAVVSSAHRTLLPPPLIVVVVDDDGTATTRTSTTTSGADTHEWCAVWRDKGECRRRVDYMRTHCPVSCATASNKEKDSHEDTMETEANDDDDDNDDDTDVLATTRIALLETTIVFGERQRADGEQAQETLELIAQTVLYLQSDLVSTSTSSPPPLFDDIMMRHNHCRNHHELCAFWAVLGECDINTAYMHTHCGPSCRSCHMNVSFGIDLIDEKEEEEEQEEEERCVQLNTDKAEPALRHPGDLNRLFERIIRQAPGNRTWSESSEKQQPRMPLYTVHVHSRPEERTSSSSSSPTDHQSAILYPSPLSPWIVTFDNFVTDEECDALIALGYEYGYQRSDHVGGGVGGGGTAALSDPPPPRKQQHQREPKRTSENAWCSDHNGCRRRDLPQLLHQRMATVLDISPNHSEDLQILKYETEQYYRTHHDYIPQQGTVPNLTCWIVADSILTIPTCLLV